MANDDIYAALMGDAPTTQEQMQKMAQALRGQKLVGQLGMLTGDPMMGGVGKNLDTDSDTQATNIGTVREKNAQQAQVKAYQDAQTANMEAERANAAATLKETMRNHSLEHEDRLAALGMGPGGAGAGDGSLYDSLSPQNKVLVDAIGGHTQKPLPMGGNTRGQMNKTIMAAVDEKYGPSGANTWTESDWKNLQDTVDKFGGGAGPQSPGAAIRQAGSATLHMNRAMDDIKKIDNTTIVPLNQFTNWIRGEFSSPTLAGFNAKKNAIAAEVVKFLTASGGALEDRTRILSDLDAAQSPAAVQSVVDSFKGMMADQMSQYKNQYTKGTYGVRGQFEDLLDDGVRDDMAARNPTIQPSKATQAAMDKAGAKVAAQPPQPNSQLSPEIQALLDKHAPVQQPPAAPQ